MMRLAPGSAACASWEGLGSRSLRGVAGARGGAKEGDVVVGGGCGGSRWPGFVGGRASGLLSSKSGKGWWRRVEGGSSGWPAVRLPAVGRAYAGFPPRRTTPSAKANRKQVLAGCLLAPGAPCRDGGSHRGRQHRTPALKAAERLCTTPNAWLQPHLVFSGGFSKRMSYCLL